ncbi:AIG2-like family protein [Forsythia ovata]|uniref:Gamma-glutamylcyclotransferase family protein n=1 Tax=Forsythia ovata TaxID=205694 RepID=A0ABD1WHQ7_9LAMI
MANGGGGDDISLIFTYGTLKRGFYNHMLIEDLMRTSDAVFLGDYSTIESFPLVVGPHGIPYLINLPGSGHRVRGELYSVSSDRGLARLDELERIDDGHYERLPVEVTAEDGGEKVAAVEAYFAHREFGEAMWERCGKEGLIEFSMALGGKYVKRDNRPSNSSFLGDIKKFISGDN